MGHHLRIFILKHAYPIILVLMTGFMCFMTYKPGTWLTGWDSLHPEFNFGLNFERILNGVWREEQGLGAVAAHAHMSELPRYILLWIFSWVFPTSFLRYLYVFICFILGPLGMFYFLRHVLHEREQSGYHLSESVIRASAFLGSLFYIFNLAVLHHFLVPFEMFPTKYGLLPWLFLFATSYFEKKKRKDLVLFAVVTFFSTPMAYAFQLWYVYFGSLGLYVSMLFLFHRTKKHFKRIVIILGVTLAINAYWFLPHLYFLADSAKHTPEAHSNMLFSERMFAFNKARGSLLDTAVLQGPLYDWSKFDGQSFVSLFDSLKGHIDQPLIATIGFISFGILIIGLVRLIFHRNTVGYALIPVLFVCFIFMANTSPPFDFFFSYLRDNISLLKEGLRSPYTKFSIMLLFTYSFFFAYAQPVIIETIGSALRKVYVGSIALLLIIYIFPLFTGNLIETSMKQNIPDDYFHLFQWFDKQPHDTRIATLPVNSFWGWEYYKWGYQGAGFIWFGLPQSVLVRDFDRWNPGNENFYWEFSYAIYSQNPDLLNAVLHKYNVNWLLVDKNIISPPNPKSLYFNEFELIASTVPTIHKVKTFGNISVYKVDLDYQSQDSQFTLKDPEIIAPVYKWSNEDRAFEDYGHYIAPYNQSDSPTVIYPFRSLFTGRALDKTPLDVTLDGNELYLTSPIEYSNDLKKDYSLTSENSNEIVSFQPDTLETLPIQSAEIVEIGDKLALRIPKLEDYYTYDNKTDPNFEFAEMSRCDQSLLGPIERYETEEGNLRFISKNASNCLDIQIPQLSHRYSYLVSVDTKNIEGTPFLFSIQNLDSKKSEADTYLPRGADNTTSHSLSSSHFIIPPLEYFGLSYALHFDSLSIGSERTINDLGRIHVQQFPYKFTQSLRLEKKVKLPSGNFIVYSQNFDQAWKAYELSCQTSAKNCWLQTTFPFIFGHELKDHVLVNNWANGWRLRQGSGDPMGTNIVIIFCPQYLEYAGFLLLGVTMTFFLYMTIHIKKHSDRPSVEKKA